MIRFATIGMDDNAAAFLEAASRSRRLYRAYACPGLVGHSLLFQGQHIDAVYIAGTVSSRFRLARRLLSEHKHVMCGNLGSAGPETLDSLIRCARSSGVSLTEALPPGYINGIFNLRTHMARLGAVSRVSFQSCRFTRQFPEPGRLTEELKLQCVRPMAELLGMPKRITAEAVILENGQPGANTILAEYSDSLSAELLYSDCSGCRISNRIQGEFGELRFKDLAAPRQLVFYSPDGGRELLPCALPGPSQAEEWLSHMDGTSDWQARLKSARLAAAVMDMACIRRSAGHPAVPDRTASYSQSRTAQS